MWVFLKCFFKVLSHIDPKLLLLISQQQKRHKIAMFRFFVRILWHDLNDIAISLAYLQIGRQQFCEQGF